MIAPATPYPSYTRHISRWRPRVEEYRATSQMFLTQDLEKCGRAPWNPRRSSTGSRRTGRRGI